MSIPSPCTRQCGVGADNVCVSCGRTVREIRIWSKADDKEREEIVAASRRRRALQELRDEGLQDDIEEAI